jgi:hypothetical protein
VTGPDDDDGLARARGVIRCEMHRCDEHLHYQAGVAPSTLAAVLRGLGWQPKVIVGHDGPTVILIGPQCALLFRGR